MYLVVAIWSGTVELTAREEAKLLEPNLRCHGTRIVEGLVDPRCHAAEPKQFKKFLWILNDGWPRWAADDLLAHYGAKAQMHSVHIPGIRLSHAIYMSYYTGVSDVVFWTSRRCVSKHPMS